MRLTWISFAANSLALTALLLLQAQDLPVGSNALAVLPWQTFLSELSAVAEPQGQVSAGAITATWVALTLAWAALNFVLQVAANERAHRREQHQQRALSEQTVQTTKPKMQPWFPEEPSFGQALAQAQGQTQTQTPASPEGETDQLLVLAQQLRDFSSVGSAQSGASAHPLGQDAYGMQDSVQAHEALTLEALTEQLANAPGLSPEARQELQRLQRALEALQRV